MVSCLFVQLSWCHRTRCKLTQVLIEVSGSVHLLKSKWLLWCTRHCVVQGLVKSGSWLIRMLSPVVLTLHRTAGTIEWCGLYKSWIQAWIVYLSHTSKHQGSDWTISSRCCRILTHRWCGHRHIRCGRCDHFHRCRCRWCDCRWLGHNRCHRGWWIHWCGL